MTHERSLALLDDYVGGELPDIEAAALRRHLEGCQACRAEERALAALLAEAAALPAGVAPTRDLWQGIAVRLEPRTAAGAEQAAAPDVIPLRPRTPVHRAPPAWLLAAAAVLLVVTSSFVTLAVTRPGGGAAEGVMAGGPAPANTAFAAFEPAEREYHRAIGDLRVLLESRQVALAPETEAVLEENLRIIDEAIRQSREALMNDPNSRELASMLSAAYDSKIEVLERAVQL